MRNPRLVSRSHYYDPLIRRECKKIGMAAGEATMPIGGDNGQIARRDSVEGLLRDYQLKPVAKATPTSDKFMLLAVAAAEVEVAFKNAIELVAATLRGLFRFQF